MSGRTSAREAGESRRAIVDAAASLASVEGLDNVTIGRLATELGMSKSGVIGQFGSKENLQLATVDLAFHNFASRVWEPVQHRHEGLPRLLAVCESWTAYAAAPGYPGGCCVAQFTFDFDARSGPVHDRIAAGLRRWRTTVTADIAIAIERGDLPATVQPDQTAFALESIASGMTPARLIHEDADAAAWALHAMRAVLGVPAAPSR